MNNILKKEKNKYSKNISVLYTPTVLENNQIIRTKIGLNKPLIFKRKESPIKTLRYINNDTGKMKHFTPGAQEWFNSIYSYNENYTKLLPIADKKLMNLLKSYFNCRY